MRSGSSGATALCSAIRCSLLLAPCSFEELAEVLDLLQPLFGGHPQDAGHLCEHMRANDDRRFELRAQCDAGGRQEALQRLPGRTGLTSLNARDDGLGGTGPAREGALAETRASTGLTEQCGSRGHGQ